MKYVKVTDLRLFCNIPHGWVGVVRVRAGWVRVGSFSGLICWNERGWVGSFGDLFWWGGLGWGAGLAWRG